MDHPAIYQMLALVLPFRIDPGHQTGRLCGQLIVGVFQISFLVLLAFTVEQTVCPEASGLVSLFRKTTTLNKSILHCGLNMRHAGSRETKADLQIS